jgi:hypothetical protein
LVFATGGKEPFSKKGVASFPDYCAADMHHENIPFQIKHAAEHKRIIHGYFVKKHINVT